MVPTSRRPGIAFGFLRPRENEGRSKGLCAGLPIIHRCCHQPTEASPLAFSFSSRILFSVIEFSGQFRCAALLLTTRTGPVKRSSLMTLPRQIPALTGIRGVAALGVALLHLSPKCDILLPAWKYGDPLFSFGGEGIPLFYILSGFILAHVYDAPAFSLRAGSLLLFLRHRIFRIYPVHLATLLFLGVLVLAAHFRGMTLTGDYHAKAFVYNIFLIQKFPFLQEDGWNYPSWSISVEWFSYLFIFPLGCLLVRRFRLAAFALAAVYFFVVLSIFTKDQRTFPNTYGVLQGGSLFLAGMFLHAFAVASRSFAGFGQAALPLVGTTLIAIFFWSSDASHTLFELACPILLLAGLSPGASFTRLLSTSAILFLGEISYSLYMTHGIVDKLLKIVLPPEHFAASPLLSRLGILAVYWAAVALAALLCYFIIERPSRTWLKRRFG